MINLKNYTEVELSRLGYSKVREGELFATNDLVEIDKDKRYAEILGSQLLARTYKDKITKNNTIWRKI